MNSLTQARASEAFEMTDLSKNTVLYITPENTFKITNASGQTAEYMDGSFTGDLDILGVNLVVSGEGAPCTYMLLVNSSDSFTCSSTETSGKILAFYTLDSTQYAGTSIQEAEETGWDTVTVSPATEIVVAHS